MLRTRVWYLWLHIVSVPVKGWAGARLMGLLHIIYVIEVKFKLNFSLVCQYRLIVRSATTLFPPQCSFIDVHRDFIELFIQCNDLCQQAGIR